MFYGSGFLKLEVKGATKFRNNLSGIRGDDIYAIKTKNKLVLDVVSFFNPDAKNSIYAENV